MTESTEKICPECGKSFTKELTETKHCSHSCATKSTYRRGLRQYHPSYCPRCGKHCQAVRQLYCSFECRRLDITEKWAAGLPYSDHPFKKLSQWMKDYLLKEANYRCTECNWSKKNPFSGKIPLEVDHIDGNTTNNERSNLKVLCPCCHALTPTYRTLNPRGSGRRSKRVPLQQHNQTRKENKRERNIGSIGRVLPTQDTRKITTNKGKIK